METFKSLFVASGLLISTLGYCADDDIFGEYKLIQAINNDCFNITLREKQFLTLLPDGIGGLDAELITVAVREDTAYSLHFAAYEGHYFTEPTPRQTYDEYDVQFRNSGRTLDMLQIKHRTGEDPFPMTMFQASFELGENDQLSVDLGTNSFGDPMSCIFEKIKR